MSYQTYITDAVVIGSYDNNTADKSYLLFTKRAGMLYATARSVREERSRQRYALQDFSHINVTLVKGKGGWRIGSVDTRGNYFMQALTRDARGSIVQLTKVMRRYVQGEEPHPDLYDIFTEAFNFIVKPDTENQELVTIWATVRILAQLGYVAPTATLTPFLEKEFNGLSPAMLVANADDLYTAYKGAQAVTHLEC